MYSIKTIAVVVVLFSGNDFFKIDPTMEILKKISGKLLRIAFLYHRIKFASVSVDSRICIHVRTISVRTQSEFVFLNENESYTMSGNSK